MTHAFSVKRLDRVDSRQHKVAFVAVEKNHGTLPIASLHFGRSHGQVGLSFGVACLDSNSVTDN